MLRNYLIIAWRVLWNNKLFSLINILGLAVGMTVFLLIMLYVNYEMSYDKSWTGSKNIYRVALHQFINGKKTDEKSTNFVAVAPAVQSALPEVINATRFYIWDTGQMFIQYTDNDGEVKQIDTDHYYPADSNFFKIFDIPFVKGDPVTAMRTHMGMVINENIADKLFGPDWRNAEPGSALDPIGKTLTGVGDYGRTEVTLAGIMEQLPTNSHLNCEIVYNAYSYHNSWATRWAAGDRFADKFYTYIKVSEHTNIQNLRKKIEKLDIPGKGAWEQQGNRAEFPLQPVESIHMNSDLLKEIKPPGNITLINALKAIAFVILLLAWVNYINLSTAKSLEWTKEVGVRKIAGASRKQLIIQFLLNTALLTLISSILTITLLQLLVPFFNALINLELSLAFIVNGLTNELAFYLVCVVLFIVCTLCAGIYPALVLSCFNPISCFKGKSIRYGSFSTLNPRKALVLVQIAITMVLLTGTMTMYWQTSYMVSSPLGFDKDQIIVLENSIREDSTYQTKYQTFKNELYKTTNFSKVSSSSTIPGIHNWSWHYSRDGSEDKSLFTMISVDPDFFKCYGLEFITGRGFIQDHNGDQQTVIINETVLKQLGFQDPYDALGKKIRDDTHTKNIRTVIGVIKDYHQSSLKNSYEPIIFLPQGGILFFNGVDGKVNTTDFREDNTFISINIHLAQGNISPSRAVELLAKIWKEVLPAQPFKYYFLNEQFDAQYKTEMLFRKLFGYFSAIAIFIACSGLFGLSYYDNQQRTKEIGIRKTLGATVHGLFVLLCKGTMKLVLIAFVITLPLSYFLLRNWLQDYAFRIDITPWLFVIPAFAVIFITLFTVGYQTIKTAIENPVKALRYE